MRHLQRRLLFVVPHLPRQGTPPCQRRLRLQERLYTIGERLHANQRMHDRHAQLLRRQLLQRHCRLVQLRMPARLHGQRCLVLGHRRVLAGHTPVLRQGNMHQHGDGRRHQRLRLQMHVHGARLRGRRFHVQRRQRVYAHVRAADGAARHVRRQHGLRQPSGLVQLYLYRGLLQRRP